MLPTFSYSRTFPIAWFRLARPYRAQKKENLNILAESSDEELEYLYLSPKKCKFFCTQVRHLGYFIDENGLQPDPEKIQPVIAFIPDFATITSPLHLLLKKNIKWLWEVINKSILKP